MKKILIALGAILIILLVVPFLIPADSIRARVEQAASEAAGMKVTIAALHLKVLPLPGVSISDLAVYDVPGGTPRVTVGSGSVSVEVMPLFSGQVEMNSIRFSNIRLRVSDKAKGKDVHTVLIDHVVGKVRLGESKLTLPDWRAQLYRGKIDLDAEIAPLEGKQRTIRATIKAAGIQMQPLVTDASGQKRMSGTLKSTMKVYARGENSKAIERSLKVDGPVKLTNGQFYEVSLKGIASLLIPGSSSSGDIAYDNMDTQLTVRGKDIRADNIALNSDVLDAKGKVHIAADKKLDGEVLVTSKSGLSGAKLLVGGTTDTPLIYPAPSSMIGGVIGGSVGGSTGAAIGSKIGGSVGSAIEGIGGLLGGSSDKKK